VTIFHIAIITEKNGTQYNTEQIKTRLKGDWMKNIGLPILSFYIHSNAIVASQCKQHLYICNNTQE